MKARFITSLFLLFPLVLAACAPAASKYQNIIQTVAVEAPAATEAPAPTAAPAALEAPAGPYPAAGATPASVEGAQVQNATLPLPNQPSGRMIIKDAMMNLLVANPDLAIERVTQLAADQGGYLISSRSWMDNGFKNAELKMGVPSARFEDTLNQLRHMAVQVLDDQSSGTDVSADYADLQARLTNLEATADRVRGFLAQATTVDQSLKINATLSDLEGQIEQVKGQMKFYEGRSAYSTITVLITPQQPTATVTPTPTATSTPTATPGWNPGKTVSSASTVMRQMLQGSIDLLIWAVFLLWPFALVAVIAWLIVRRIRRKPGKPQAEPEESEKP